MSRRLEDARILMYSHDTFGLGHLRRCRAIAHALVEDYRGLNILIISGATIAGAFDYRARVDFVKIPSVIKLRNGEYTSLASHIDLHETLKMRESSIRHTAETFQPDIFIVDKEPMGLKGEVEDTLAYLKARGTVLVLGLREIMDAPHLLEAEWKKNSIMQKIDQYYDSVWVYGPPDFYDPLIGLDVPPSLRRKMDFVGFLQRSVSRGKTSINARKDNYILVTTGGGGGEELAKLKALASELGISGRIVWKGAMAQEDVLDHYRRADLFALACRIAANGDRDGLPNVLVEASSQRLVCVSTEVSGVPELLKNGENGLVVPPEDPALLARALEAAIRDPALRKRLGDAAENQVREHFDYHSSIRQLTGLFEAEWQKAS
ncbi:glycosyltransferase [Rhizobium leguminosarum]|uniref:Glycosyltransferase n=2 Tax=Rhizobium leguminosarum TaxID=384 RepID=A0A444HN70_RHILE|nr:glycosyltransferase [Rhizobium leguminosarum]RWX23816.1 glycosyltransferase [Rhizobium leguminosarum]